MTGVRYILVLGILAIGVGIVVIGADCVKRQKGGLVVK